MSHRLRKVGMTHTYANENEEQSRGFAGRIFKEYNTIKRQQQQKVDTINSYPVCKVLFCSSCLNTHCCT